MAKYISEDMIYAMCSVETFCGEDEKNLAKKATHNGCCESCLAVCQEVKNDMNLLEDILDVFLGCHVVTKEKAIFCAMLCLSTQRKIPNNIRHFLEENLTAQEFWLFLEIESNMQKMG